MNKDNAWIKNLKTGKWYHIGFGSNGNLYINGKLTTNT